MPNPLYRRRSRRGFTLVELLAALALTSLLAAGWAGSLRGLTAQRKLTDEKLGNRPAQRRFFARLEQEIAQAYHVQSEANRFALSGFGGTDPNTGYARHLQTEIEYLIQTDDGGSRLVRCERPIGERQIAVDPAEVVLSDVKDISISAIDDNTGRARTGTWQGAPPNRLQIALRNSSGAAVGTETLYVR